MTNDKKCRDCKWVQESMHGEEYDRCIHAKTTSQFCQLERLCDVELEFVCGKSGRFWEARDE